MPVKPVISPEEGAALQRLYQELEVAKQQVRAAITASERVPDGLARRMEAERVEATIVRRIKEILGTTGEPWNA